MQFSELMTALSQHPIRLQQDDDNLVILGDDEGLDNALWDSLIAHKRELLELVERNGGDWLSPAFRITPDMLPWPTSARRRSTGLSTAFLAVRATCRISTPGAFAGGHSLPLPRCRAG